VSTERGYQTDPFCWEFQADITGRIALPDGRKGVLLAKTYFYPTGGGQEHDTGTLGDAMVTDVIADDEGNIIHVVDRDLGENTVPARIDGSRRFAFMQQHSGQHLLSQAFERELGLETVSAHMSIDSPSTIDLKASDVRQDLIARVERSANAMIYQDLPIQSYFVPGDKIATVPLRRPPKVQGQVRIVEIEGYDYSACGGTHCTRSGMIGVVKVLKSERRGDRVRIYFAAGGRALQYFQDYYAILTRIAQLYSTSPDSVVPLIERQLEAQQAQQKDLQELQAMRIAMEANQLVARAEVFDGIKLVAASFRDRSPRDLRTLASVLQNEPGVIALLASYDGEKLTLTVTCARDTGVSANELIRKQLAEISGRGGGDAQLAQGGGAADEKQVESFFAKTREYIKR
jgi:alanyl-tRNA synthetase